MKSLKRSNRAFPGAFVLLLGFSTLSGMVSGQTYVYNQAGLGVGNKPSGITVTDFNSDGRLDLAVANQNDSTVSVVLSRSDGTFAPKVDYKVGPSARTYIGTQSSNEVSSSDSASRPG